MLINKKINLNFYDYIVFDFDGVIAETDIGRFETLSKILVKHGIDITNKFSLNDIAGTPTDIFLKKYYSHLGANQIEKIVQERRVEYLTNLEKYCIVYPGCIETLNDLFNLGHKMYLATTNHSYIIEKLIEYLGISKLFYSIFPREKIINKKSNRKDYGLLLATTNIDPLKAIVIEDSLMGIQSAKEQNFLCIAFNWFNSKKVNDLSDFSICSYKELRTVFGLNDNI